MQRAEIDKNLRAIWDLNQSEVPHVGDATEEKMRWYLEAADVVLVKRAGDELEGFLIGFDPGHEYTSTNYRWFCDRYSRFAYVDRIVVARSVRGTGLGRRLYEEFAAMRPGVPLAAEVNVHPPNPASMDFHQRMGFVEVGQKADGAKTVAMLLQAL